MAEEHSGPVPAAQRVGLCSVWLSSRSVHVENVQGAKQKACPRSDVSFNLDGAENSSEERPCQTLIQGTSEDLERFVTWQISRALKWNIEGGRKGLFCHLCFGFASRAPRYQLSPGGASVVQMLRVIVRHLLCG